MPVGVPQGGILEPVLFFSIYVKDLPDCHLASDIILYAGDTVIYYSYKYNFVIFGSHQKLNRIQDFSVQLEGTCIVKIESFEYLGVTLHQSMSWADHVDAISVKINQRTGLIRRIRNLLPLQTRISLYNSLILPLFNYGDTIWGNKNDDTIMLGFQILQNKAGNVLLGHPPRSSSTEALKSLDLISIIGETDFIFNFLKNHAVHSYNTRLGHLFQRVRDFDYALKQTHCKMSKIARRTGTR